MAMALLTAYNSGRMVPCSSVAVKISIPCHIRSLPNGFFLKADDQLIRSWDLTAAQCVQRAPVPDGGQVTVLDVIEDPPTAVPLIAVLFSGTGYGYVSVIPMTKAMPEFNFQKAHTIQLFHEPIESQAIDSVNSRYAAAGHTGTIKVFAIDDYSLMTPLWQLDIGNLPISTHFHGTERNLIVHALYTSEILCFDVSNRQKLGVATLHGKIGSATFSPDEGMMAVHNLTSDEVDVYIPATAHMPKYHLNIEAEEGVPKKFAFTEEKGRTLICGSDDGVIYVFDVATGAFLHTLEHTEDSSTVHCVATYSTHQSHFIASGETSVRCACIHIWIKPTDTRCLEIQQRWRDEAVAEALKVKGLEEERLAQQKEAEEADMKARLAELEQVRCIELEKLRAELENSLCSADNNYFQVGIILLNSSKLVFDYSYTSFTCCPVS
ncbi:WD40-repeat-containing domain protein [Armillaria novae-zelandiae]|uniref:WD40-repeat-containing domain protein n=1 Tax=Armillaria novae-zelandiae TaxID=153914 RepID=A0AA39T9F3_9AGAR|nr:WD40-repeat-containing domain protein [Armillaria novae-zelandiae]